MSLLPLDKTLADILPYLNPTQSVSHPVSLVNLFEHCQSPCPFFEGGNWKEEKKQNHQDHGRHFLVDIDLDHTLALSPITRSACAVSIPKLAIPVTGPRTLEKESTATGVGQLAPAPPSNRRQVSSWLRLGLRVFPLFNRNTQHSSQQHIHHPPIWSYFRSEPS